MGESNTHRAKEPWDRRREESESAYHAFEIYAELPPGQRSLKAAYRRHTGNENAAGPSDNFKGWAKRFDWADRAAALDGAKASARFEGELAGIRDHWAEIAAQRERAHTQLLDLTDLAYEKAKEIYAKELTKDNYSMAHAVQMSKFTLEVYKMLTELEKVYRGAEQDRWTEEDERAVADALEELEPDDATKFFEEQARKKREEEEKGSGEDEKG